MNHDGHDGHDGNEDVHDKRRHEGLEGLEGHDDGLGSYRMRVPSPLSAAEEAIITRVIGGAIAVHKELGPGFIELIYRKAMCVEFNARDLTFETERPGGVVLADNRKPWRLADQLPHFDVEIRHQESRLVRFSCSSPLRVLRAVLS